MPPALLAKSLLDSTLADDRLVLALARSWTAAHSCMLEGLVDAAAPRVANAKALSVDMAGVRELETLGAWLLERLLRSAHLSKPEAQFIGLPPLYRGLIEEVHRLNLRKAGPPTSPNKLWAALDNVRRAAAGLASDAAAFLGMLGELGAAMARIIAHPRRFRLTSAVYHLFRVGWQACRS